MKKLSKTTLKIVILLIIAVVLVDKEQLANLFVNNINRQVEVKDVVFSDLYSVKYVIDGDTIVVDIEGLETTIRLIGINCPESVHPDESKNTEEGKLASNFTRELLTGKKVKLEFDAELMDKYGRTLAYVYLEDGTMVNEYIISEGYAYVETIIPNVKYADTFVRAFNSAVENKKGLWYE